MDKNKNKNNESKKNERTDFAEDMTNCDKH